MSTSSSAEMKPAAFDSLATFAPGLFQGQNVLVTGGGVVTLSFSGRKGQGLVDIQAKQAAIFHASKASRRW